MADEQKVASKGATFMDTRFSPVKFITTDDDRGYEKGTHVFIGVDTKIYGPYQLDMEVARGNGKVHWKAFSLSSKAQQKPLTKSELEQQNAQLLARLAQLEANANKK